MKWRHTIALASAFLLAGCKKADAPGSGSSAPTSATLPTANTTKQSAADDDVDAPLPPAHPIPEIVDTRGNVTVWLDVNDQRVGLVPQGWPLIITATVLGARGPA